MTQDTSSTPPAPPVLPTPDAALVAFTPALRETWQRHLEALWRGELADNRLAHEQDVVRLIGTMPRPSLFNRRKDEVARLVNDVLALDLAWTGGTIYPNVHKTPGWDHHGVVMVAERTLYLGGQFDGQRSFRLTPEQQARFDEQGQRWDDRRTAYLGQEPSQRDLRELVRREHEAQSLRQEMRRRPRSGHRRRRGGGDDDSGWNSPSSPVPNPYNGFS